MIDKNKVSAAFDRAADSYDAIATFQHQVCERLAAQLPTDLLPRHILDAGCGTGYGADLLRQRFPSANFLACDLAPEMVRKTQARGVLATVGDLEHLPFPDNRFDLAWSSLALQWCDPACAYAELYRVLTHDGLLACTTLANGTLHELETAFAGIDQHQRVLNFFTPQEIEATIAAAGFSQIHIVRETFVTRHSNFRSLLETIRGIGASQAGQNRRRALMGKQAWQSAQSRYEAMRDRDGMLPATYEVMFVFAQKN